jgi:hypothetical protein
MTKKLALAIGTCALAVVTLSGCTTATAPTPSATAASNQLPLCSSLLGKTAAESVDTSTGIPKCHFIPGAKTENIGHVAMSCSKDGSPLYSWQSNDPASPDSNVYAVRKNGLVVTVPHGRDGLRIDFEMAACS